jgi:protein-tyrosine phosphatase
MGKIYLEGADNARDLGGLKTTEGAVIREKKLIRSNRLSKLTQNDIHFLSDEYHLHKILDLRTPMEVEQEADLKIPEASYMNIPFFMESMVGVSREQETRKQMLHMEEFPNMEDIYVMMVQNEFCNQQISKAVKEVMNTENGSVLWHCTEGKDRCGLLSAIILFLLDVSEDDVMEDYLKTNKAAIRRVEKIRKKLHLAGFHQEKIEKLEGYFVAKEEFLNAALTTMKEDHGSINQFIKNGLHISMEEKQQFKDKILE